jgi:acyl dehydratase
MMRPGSDIGQAGEPTMLYFEDLRIGDSRSIDGHELGDQDIIAFARQWDPQPWHVDPVAAARTPMKGLTASSCHTFCVASLLLSRMEPAAVIASIKHEIGMPNPARPGDRLTLTLTCSDKRPSQSKPDRGLVTFDSVLKNQDGTAVLEMRSLLLVRTRPTGGDLNGND